MQERVLSALGSESWRSAAQRHGRGQAYALLTLARVFLGAELGNRPWAAEDGGGRPGGTADVEMGTLMGTLVGRSTRERPGAVPGSILMAAPRLIL